MPSADRPVRTNHRYRRVVRNIGRATRTRSRKPGLQTFTDPRDVGAVAKPPGRSLRLAALVFVHYALVASDIRFVSTANYAGVAAVNVLIAINTWYLTRGIIEAKTRTDRVCFVIGGTTGALVAVLLT
jgi:hypothetical protein